MKYEVGLGDVNGNVAVELWCQLLSADTTAVLK